jgi:hypothetical protein
MENDKVVELRVDSILRLIEVTKPIKIVLIVNRYLFSYGYYKICCKSFYEKTHSKIPSTTIYEDMRDTYLRTVWTDRVIRVVIISVRKLCNGIEDDTARLCVDCRWVSLELRLRKEIA